MGFYGNFNGSSTELVDLILTEAQSKFDDGENPTAIFINGNFLYPWYDQNIEPPKVPFTDPKLNTTYYEEARWNLLK